MTDPRPDLDAIREAVVARGDAGYEAALLAECERLTLDNRLLTEFLAEQHEQDAGVVARLKGERDGWRRSAETSDRAWIVQHADLARLRESRARLLEALVEYGVHQFPCPFAQVCGGRPTTDGGYETRYGEKWYPRGQEPECTCGLKDAIAAAETKEET